jgi:oxygen-dependent protoporphyrinogen oxidase
MNLPPPRTIPRIIIAGGGISGLAAAHRILEESRRLNFPVHLQLLEAGRRLGGVIHTVERDGFLLEGGPDSFISEKPWAVSLCQRIGLAAQLIGTGESHRRSFIVRDGKLHPVPDGFYLMAPTQIWPAMTTRIFSWPGKLRMSADLFLPRKPRRTGDDDESLASFVRRRLGQEALERMAQPMVGGIYTSDPEELSLRATMPRFLQMEEEHRSLILAMWRQRRQVMQTENSRPAGPRYGLFVSLDQGMKELIETLRNQLPAEAVRLNTRLAAMRFDPDKQEWDLTSDDGTKFRADGVCLALASYEAADLVKDLDAALARKLRGIRYASTATVNLAYRIGDVPRPLEGFGFVVPAVEKREILACTFSHIKFEGRAPKDMALFRAFIGGALQPRAFEYDDAAMIGIVRQNLQELLGIRQEPLFTQLERHPRAMPQYRVGHLKLVDEIECSLRQFPTLQLAGNAFTGVGIPDCVRRAEQCAGQLLSRLREAQPPKRVVQEPQSQSGRPC